MVQAYRLSSRSIRLYGFYRISAFINIIAQNANLHNEHFQQFCDFDPPPYSHGKKPLMQDQRLNK